MFNSVIGSLASLLPKYFMFGSYVPVLIFSFINGALAVGTTAGARDFVLSLSGPGLVFATTVAFVLTVVAAYILSSVATFLREVLEGTRLWPFLAGRMRDRQAAVRADLDVNRRGAGLELAQVLGAIPGWRAEIVAAAARGRSKHPGIHGYDPERDPAGRELRKIQRTMSAVSFGALKTVVTLFIAASETYDNSADAAIGADFHQLLIAFGDARDALDAKERALYRDRHTRFGLTDVAPTAMGNVAAALQGYTSSRYSFDLDVMWSRLLLVLQKTDEKGYGSLLDAKTQLDFLIACTWLCAVTSAVWAVMLAVFSVSPWTFVLVLAGGMILASFFYSMAITNYIAYGSIIRATVDLNRFALLRQLHIPLPAGVRDERALWTGLRGLSSFAEPVEVSYEHPPP